MAEFRSELTLRSLLRFPLSARHTDLHQLVIGGPHSDKALVPFLSCQTDPFIACHGCSYLRENRNLVLCQRQGKPNSSSDSFLRPVRGIRGLLNASLISSPG